ncbi:MAG TPA: ABC transporter ATP-binding protein [Pirellulales bacterium]|nr:ABC transporter ATP-binding protein [Pirellulales bacterium]
MSEIYVQTRALCKRYGGLTALDECGLAVRRGEVFGLLGPNGSGKTTLLRLLMGFLRPTSGEATIAGLDCYRDSVAIHRRAAYLPGDARLFPQMRGHGVLRFFSRVRPDAELSRSLALAQRLKLDLTRRVAALSTGMRQKLALAAVLALDSPLLVLDEPTSNLDPTVRGDVLDLVREARSAGRTVIFSSHVLDEVEQVCDRVGILRHGRLVWVQLMSELRRQHRIRARLTAPLSAIAPAMAGPLDISVDAGRLTILTPGELSPLLGWLATLPLAEVQIEPVGLRAVYDRYHLASEGESA